MTKIEFFYDPSCPFCWITSRWLLQVAEHRPIDITWRQFSLALKNHEMQPDDHENSHAAQHRESHRVHRVIAAAVQYNEASQIELYSEFGMRFHILEQPFGDAMIREVITAKRLPQHIAKAADDTSYDEYLQDELAASSDGKHSAIGVPTIIFVMADKTRVAYFGPVINEMPATLEESLAIWDGLEKLTAAPSFYEIKRSRPDDPNVFSAARC